MRQVALFERDPNFTVKGGVKVRDGRDQKRDEKICILKREIKQAVGDLTGNKRLKREGRTQGQVEGAVKDAKCAVNGRIRN